MAYGKQGRNQGLLMPSDFSTLPQAPRIGTQNIQIALFLRTAVLSSGSGGIDCVCRGQRGPGSGLALLCRPGTYPKPFYSDKNKRFRVLGQLFTCGLVL